MLPAATDPPFVVESECWPCNLIASTCTSGKSCFVSKEDGRGLCFDSSLVHPEWEKCEAATPPAPEIACWPCDAVTCSFDRECWATKWGGYGCKSPGYTTTSTDRRKCEKPTAAPTPDISCSPCSGFSGGNVCFASKEGRSLSAPVNASHPDWRRCIDCSLCDGVNCGGQVCWRSISGGGGPTSCREKDWTTTAPHMTKCDRSAWRN